MPTTLSACGAPTDAELEPLADLQSRTFGGTLAERLERYDTIGRAELRVVRRGEVLAGGLARLPMGQHFGGRRVDCCGIASVVVRPELRGAGCARELMESTLRELALEGTALSCLYPSTRGLYRKVGYEVAGEHASLRIPLRDLADLASARLPTRRLRADEEPLRRALYDGWARRHAGHLDRHALCWERTTLRGPDRAEVYGVHDEDELVGYVSYFASGETGARRLLVTDFVSKDALAARALLAHLARQAPQARDAVFQGRSRPEWLVELPLPIGILAAGLEDAWMLRVVDVEAALEQRGYPRGVEGTLDLFVEDPLIAGNAGAWRLTVRAGRGQVERGGTGDLALSTRQLAQLYTGFATPAEQELAGSQEARALATSFFTGDLPSLPDFF